MSVDLGLRICRRGKLSCRCLCDSGLGISIWVGGGFAHSGEAKNGIFWSDILGRRGIRFWIADCVLWIGRRSEFWSAG